jgi:DNA-binding beta-propeller fold protein YncE
VRYDSAARKAYVGYGTGGLRVIDVTSDKVVADIRLDGHPESFQLEQSGSRIFVNVPTAKHVAVVDRTHNRIIATWATPNASSTYSMALDEEGHRLFVGARSPAVMLVYDTNSGNVVARHTIGQDTDDIFFDSKHKRVYVICGEGRIDVFSRDKMDMYVLAHSLQTAARARTGLLVAEDARLYVAAPASERFPARVLVYKIGT